MSPPSLIFPPYRVPVLRAAPQPSFLVEGGPAALHGSPELPEKIQPASEADWPGTCLSLPSPPLCTAPCPLQSSLQRHFSPQRLLELFLHMLFPLLRTSFPFCLPGKFLLTPLDLAQMSLIHSFMHHFLLDGDKAVLKEQTVGRGEHSL